MSVLVQSIRHALPINGATREKESASSSKVASLALKQQNITLAVKSNVKTALMVNSLSTVLSLARHVPRATTAQPIKKTECQRLADQAHTRIPQAKSHARPAITDITHYLVLRYATSARQAIHAKLKIKCPRSARLALMRLRAKHHAHHVKISTFAIVVQL